MSENQNAIKEETVTYEAGGKTMRGFMAYQEGTAKRPAVIVVHEWWGLTEYPKMRARELAKLGYVAFAVDMFGGGDTATTTQQAQKMAGAFYTDPQLGKSRLDAGINFIKGNDRVDTSKLAAIGYCFGGSMVINGAKLGSDLDGVVSFHGGLQGPKPLKKEMVKAKFLVLNGEADSMVPADQVANFKKEMTGAGLAYEFHSFPNAKHAFTNPASTANGEKFKIDIAYNKEADMQSWQMMKDFLSRIFAN